MLLTRPRIAALANMSRFAGWTSRPYSVLEHSVIGARVLADIGYSRMTQKAFMLHDLHETEFGGDITSPIKHKYMPEAYYADVLAWDARLSFETGIPLIEIDGPSVKLMDQVMLAAETRKIYTGESGWRAPVPDGCTKMLSMAVEKVYFETFSRETVQAFWQMWGGE